MILDIAKYSSVNRTVVQEWYVKNKDHNTIVQTISIMACSTMCPCICVAYWLGEITEWHPDVIASIKMLTKFYGYTMILNKPEGAPELEIE